MNCLLVLSLAVLGASAAPCGFNFNTVTESCGSAVPFGMNLNTVAGCASALPGRTICGQTPIVENPTSVFPSVVPSASVSQSCHCLKTVVRPQIRTEVITVPTVDRVVRVVPSPIVEAVSVNCGGNTRNYQIPTCGVNSGICGGIAEGNSGILAGSYPRIVDGVVGGSGFGGIVNSGFVGNMGCGSNIVV